MPTHVVYQGCNILRERLVEFAQPITAWAAGYGVELVKVNVQVKKV